MGPKWLFSLEKDYVDGHLIASVRESLSVSKIVSIDKYSSLERVLRVTAWISRFIRYLKSRIGVDR